MTPSAPRRRGLMVSVTGPPGSGKTTLIAALAADAGLAVFRLRDAVARFADTLNGSPAAEDPLGWVSVEAVARLLHVSFVQGRFDAGNGPVLVDNFPGTAVQLDLLADVCAKTRRLVLVELRLSAATATGRVDARRVCLVCGPDAHHPANAGRGGRCRRCGNALVRRDSDTPDRHVLRAARFQQNIAAIGERARRCRIPHLVVDAEDNPATIRRAVVRAYPDLAFALRDPAKMQRSSL